VRLRTKNHGEVSCRIEHVPGNPQAPLTGNEVNEKCAECFSLGAAPLSAERIKTLGERVRNIERIKDMSQFFDGIC
jgi:hypothetical protein